MLLHNIIYSPLKCAIEHMQYEHLRVDLKCPNYQGILIFKVNYVAM